MRVFGLNNTSFNHSGLICLLLVNLRVFIRFDKICSEECDYIMLVSSRKTVYFGSFMEVSESSGPNTDPCGTAVEGSIRIVSIRIIRISNSNILLSFCQI